MKDLTFEHLTHTILERVIRAAECHTSQGFSAQPCHLSERRYTNRCGADFLCAHITDTYVRKFYTPNIASKKKREIYIYIYI